MDTSFFVKAFSASPAAVVPGYIIGGIAYFAIPWGQYDFHINILNK